MPIPLRACAAAVTLFAVAACSSLPSSPAQVTEHDLGAPFAIGAASPTMPLRALNVVAQPVVNGVSMDYREARNPTRRGSYAHNRWAAPPAALVDGALNRLLAVDGGGRCRLQVSLAEFIVDVDAAGKGRALLSADLRLAGKADSSGVQTSVDIAVPMAQVSPAAGAVALREAVAQLGTQAAAWLAGPAGG
ncbi:MAG: ABC-type transport auxiliary lipoprotein family protein, partial [Rhodocyclaceae bacterium]